MGTSLMNTKLTLSALFAACLLTHPRHGQGVENRAFRCEGAYPPFSWTDAGRSRALTSISPMPVCQQMAVRGAELVAQD